MGKVKRRKDEPRKLKKDADTRKELRNAENVEDPSEGKGKQQRPPMTSYDWIRENLEAIIVAFILALIIRHFSVEAFEIPTGSMAPTLSGIHAWVTCPSCDTDFNIGLQTDTETGELKVRYRPRLVYWGECPKCGMPHHRAFREDGSGLPLGPGETDFRCDVKGCGESWRGEAKDFRKDIVVFNQQMYRDPQLECPICQLRFREVITKSNRSGGHKILVNKFAYRIGRPRRWDVIVFQMDEERNYIKRLLALAGEKVALRGGDLYTQKPGEKELHIQRKLDRPEIQEVLWTKIADSDIAEKGYNPEPAWKEIFEAGSGIDSETGLKKWWTWLPEKLRWSVNVLQPRGRTAVLRFNRKCVDYYPYNLLAPHFKWEERHQVGDKKLAFTVRPAKGEGWIGGEIRDGDFTYQFRIPVGKPGPQRVATLRRLSTEIDPIRPSPGREPTPEMEGEKAEVSMALPFMEPARVEFENVDDRVSVRLNGKEILALEYQSGSPEISKDQHYLLLLASGVTADFESIQVYRDVYYTNPGGRTGADFLPHRYNVGEIGSAQHSTENEYFPCGDNSPSSYDGRFWGTFPERNLMGKAFVIFWPAWPTHWEVGFIR